jgi:hypothetical protein
MHENRETSGAPRPERERGRPAKAQSHMADAHAPEESGRAILSMNQIFIFLNELAKNHRELHL